MKSNVQPAAVALRRRAPQRWRDQFRASHRPERGLRGEHGGEQGHERADAEREGEALDFRGGEREQDERGHEGDDVRVDDRRKTAFVSRRDAGDDRSSPSDLLLDALEDHDVGVGRDSDREDQAGDARQRHRDRDQLDQREEIDAVDDQAADGDHAEHAVEEAAGRCTRPGSRARPAMRPWLSACLPSVAETCEREIRASLIGSAPDWSSLARFWADVEREAAGDLRAGRGVDAFGVLRVVDRRHGDQLPVEHDREVLQGLFLADARELGFLAAMGDFLGHLFEDGLAVAGEAEGDVAAAPVLSSVPCCGLVMSLPVRTGLSFSTYQLFGLAFVTLPARGFDGAGLHDHGAGVHAHGLRHGARGQRVVACRGCVRFPRAACAEHLFVLGVEQIPAAVDAVVDLRGRAARRPGGACWRAVSAGVWRRAGPPGTAAAPP